MSLPARRVPLFGVSATAPCTYFAVATVAQNRWPLVRDFVAWLAAAFA
jgi:hypothetical protein